jgi:hypothetical protein
MNPHVLAEMRMKHFTVFIAVILLFNKCPQIQTQPPPAIDMPFARP